MRVDIIVPCYNYARFLPDCLNSILTQDVPLKVLVIDDCSTDDTEAVAASFVRSDSRVEYRRNAQNIGHIRTYNEGLAWSSGDLTLLISADDMLTPGALKRAIAFMEANPTAGMAYGRVIRHTSGSPLQPPEVGDSSDHQLVPGRTWIENCCAAGMNTIYSPEVLTRTRLQKQVGTYDPDLPHTADFEMWMRFVAIADVGVLTADQAYYRVHTQNMHNTQFHSRVKQLQQIGAAFDKGFDHSRNHGLPMEELRIRAHKKLAMEAIRAARYAFDTGQPLDYTYQDAVNYAVRIYPRIRMHRS